MKREFMTGIPSYVRVDDGAMACMVDDDETIHNLSVQGFLMTLQDSREFHDNPTQEVMKNVLNTFIKESIVKLTQDAEWYITWAMPLFLTKDLKSPEVT